MFLPQIDIQGCLMVQETVANPENFENVFKNFRVVEKYSEIALLQAHPRKVLITTF
jgi:hypothetical protein